MSHWLPENHYPEVVEKFLTTGSEMLDSLILTFSKEGIENILLSLSSFFDAFVFSYH